MRCGPDAVEVPGPPLCSALDASLTSIAIYIAIVGRRVAIR
jgi:hypothetical protein